MVIKILGSIMIIAVCTFVGKELSKELTGRVKVLEGWVKAIIKFRNYIDCSKMPLNEIYEIIAGQNDEVGQFFYRLTQNNSSDILTFTLWKNEIANVKYMTHEDKDVILRLANELGESETQSQISYLELTRKSLDGVLSEAKEKAKNDAAMYRKMSFFTGVGIAILLI